MTATHRTGPAHDWRIITHGEDVQIEVVADAASLAGQAADHITELVRTKPTATIAFPTGRTPIRLYDELIARVRAGQLDMSQLTVFQLDEFTGLGPDHPASFAVWLRQSLLDAAGISASQFHTIPATAPDIPTAAAGFEATIAAHGGLDLVVLGIGNNGHVAFNEPGSARDSRTRLLTLTDASIAQTAADWPSSDPVPTTAVTMGIATLLDARRLLLMASGPSKAEVIFRALHDAPTADLPATLIRSAGSRLTFIVDEDAASRLS